MLLASLPRPLLMLSRPRGKFEPGLFLCTLFFSAWVQALVVLAVGFRWGLVWWLPHGLNPRPVVGEDNYFALGTESSVQYLRLLAIEASQCDQL